MEGGIKMKTRSQPHPQEMGNNSVGHQVHEECSQEARERGEKQKQGMPKLHLQG